MPNCPHHVLHRGNSQAIFLERRRSRAVPAPARDALETRVACMPTSRWTMRFACCSPGRRGGPMARLMQALGPPLRARLQPRPTAAAAPCGRAISLDGGRTSGSCSTAWCTWTWRRCVRAWRPTQRGPGPATVSMRGNGRDARSSHPSMVDMEQHVCPRGGYARRVASARLRRNRPSGRTLLAVRSAGWGGDLAGELGQAGAGERPERPGRQRQARPSGQIGNGDGRQMALLKHGL